MVRRHPSMTYELLRVMSVRLRAAHDGTIRDLHEKNQHLAQAYADLQAAQQQIIEQETLLRELRLAREIQESMLPTSLPQLAGFDIGARCLPARMVGGDFFDVIRLDAERVGIAIGDVSGKGVPAALFMALCSSLLRAEVSRGTPPEQALRLVNTQLITRNAQSMFVTLLYGVLHGPRGEFHYVRAGHEYPLAWEHSAAPLELPHVGLLPNPILDVQIVQIPPDSTLLLYTDGATEAADARGVMLGYETFCALAGASSAATAQELVDELVDEVLAHQGEAQQFDDITLVALRAGPGQP
jgi:sigma-B regulation protein RsbU (phosphoserine phosphatase)